MKNPFQKPKRGPTPDGYAIHEIKLVEERRVILIQQAGEVRESLPALQETMRQATLDALVDPTPANLKAEEDADKALDAAQAKLAKLTGSLSFLLEQKSLLENEKDITAHKRIINTTHRQLDKRDGLAPDFTATATAFFKSLEAICIANDTAYSVKPNWPGTDNGFGLAPNSFRWKLAHELWRIADELGVKWPEAARETLISDRTLTLADRLKAETVDIMDRMRQRPVLGIAADKLPPLGGDALSAASDPTGAPPVRYTPPAEAIVPPESLENPPSPQTSTTGVRADQIPIRRETLTV